VNGKNRIIHPTADARIDHSGDSDGRDFTRSRQKAACEYFRIIATADPVIELSLEEVFRGV
jgi:hypothetical protein